MRAVMFFDEWQDCLDTVAVSDRQYVRAVILENTKINSIEGTVEYQGDKDRNHGDVVTHAVYIDTDAFTSEQFEISAKVTAEVIIT